MNRREVYIRRTKVVKRERILLVVLFCFALFFSIIFVSSKTYAGNFKNTNSDSIKMFKSITIYSGDTLESIANKYMTEEYSSQISYIKELSSINGFSSTAVLIPGNRIIVPYYSTNNTVSLDPVIEISSAK